MPSDETNPPPIQRWSIVLVDLDPTLGHEQEGVRRALVVSYEPFHRSGMATVCPITSRPTKYPGEVPILAGIAGQTLDGLILTHQVRTIDLRRVTAFEVGGHPQVVRDPSIRQGVRAALAHHLGLDLSAAADGAG
jgi:mRNA-degrading endonuclease toxin of MazEF toxin-antitoxin module